MVMALRSRLGLGACPTGRGRQTAATEEMKERSTIDLVVLMMTASIGVVLAIAMIGLIIVRVVHPGVDVARGSEALGNITTMIVGSLVGFVGGRATGRWEGANGTTGGK